MSSTEAPTQPTQRTKFSPEMDIHLLQDVLDKNPFQEPQSWNVIANTLQDIYGTSGPTTGRSCRERCTLLLTYFNNDQLSKINKSGTAETYTERQQLLTEVSDLEKLSKEKGKDTKGKKIPKTDIRKRAMETLKAEPTCSGENEEEPVRVNMGKRKRQGCKDMIAYLEKKNEDKLSVKKEELNLKKEELEFNKAKFELERKEREAKIEAEKQEKKFIHEIMRAFVARQMTES